MLHYRLMRYLRSRFEKARTIEDTAVTITDELPDELSPVQPVPESLAWPERVDAMVDLARSSFSNPVNALEIGVWFGKGSTKIWHDNLPENSDLHMVDSWRPYASEADLIDPEWDYKRMDDLTDAAFQSAVRQVIEFEASMRMKSISLVRALTTAYLPSLANDRFDFIYVDGDHKYPNAKHDIQHAKRLVRKDFGVICGDDLEFLPTPDLIRIAQDHKNQDLHRCETTFHPGVLLAISEEFDEVNLKNGFWWVFCHEGRFTK